LREWRKGSGGCCAGGEGWGCGYFRTYFTQRGKVGREAKNLFVLVTLYIHSMPGENDIAKMVVDICYHLHYKYGPGLFESVYEEIFCYEWAKTGISFKRQHAIPLVHEQIKLEAGFRADIIIEDKVIVELKSIEALAPVHYRQVQTYLKLTDLRLGLLINFNVSLIKDGIHRIVNKI
jgi:GxxExxY protein